MVIENIAPIKRKIDMATRSILFTSLALPKAFDSATIFETATGEELTEEAKQAASDEMITTGELAEDIGQDEAASLVQEIKERIIKEKITDPEQIRKIIIEIAADLNINITQEHIDKLADLMERISKLDLRVENVSEQLKNINKGLEKVRETIDQNRGLFQKILDAIKGFFGWLSDLLRG